MAKVTNVVNTVRVLTYIVLSLSFVLIESAPEGALVTQVPGFNDTFPSKHYSGYVTIDEAHGKKLFYYFVLSEANPSNDPVVLWLNGGPGCSSFDGFVYEHDWKIHWTEMMIIHLARIHNDRPFNFEMGKTKGSLPKLHLNPYSWSKVSNIIYLDSPSGVGFSYSANESDYVTGDLKTASDSHEFLLKFGLRVYVPTLAYEVAKGIFFQSMKFTSVANLDQSLRCIFGSCTGIDAGVKPILNFKGYMVGNGVTDDEFDGNALVPFAHGMGLISDELFEVVHKEVTAECKGNYYNPASTSCENKLVKVDENIQDLNIYNILDECYHGMEATKTTTGNTKLPLSFRKLGETERPFLVRNRMFGRAWPLRAPVRDGIVPTWPHLLNSNNVPCIDDEVATSWLNNESVRKAIHAEQASVAGGWELCTDRILFNHDAGSMIKYHKNLTAKGYRALIYSGDHDMCVPYTGSEAWTRSVGYKIVDEWRPWGSNGQVAGYVQGYENNLTFLTVKGSGHTVPEYKPREALDFYSRWLAGKSI
ncbi:unnamed protein product [Camellia sinensis]